MVATVMGKLKWTHASILNNSFHLVTLSVLYIFSRTLTLFNNVNMQMFNNFSSVLYGVDYKQNGGVNLSERTSMACSVIFFSVYICLDLTLIGSCFQRGSSDNAVGIKILKFRYQAFYKNKKSKYLSRYYLENKWVEIRSMTRHLSNFFQDYRFSTHIYNYRALFLLP